MTFQLSAPDSGARFLPMGARSHAPFGNGAEGGSVFVYSGETSLRPADWLWTPVSVGARSPRAQLLLPASRGAEDGQEELQNTFISQV